MRKVDLHIHSTYSDGLNSIEDIIKSAIDKGFEAVGISDHSYTTFDLSYCMDKSSYQKYIDEINLLKIKYNDKIKICCGIEQDFFSDAKTQDFDYIIGSVHYLKIENTYIPVDESKEILLKAANKHFNGDIYALIELYYNTVSQVVTKTNCDIIGHIDLITKFNEDGKLFDEKDERYIHSYEKACDKLLAHNKLFEINTGAISRGYRTAPYPSSCIYNYLKGKGARFILSSDSHSKDNIGYKFDEYENLI
ncbi:MAG: histidinol-phosphatase [Ruminococcus sp.]|nr:histidinol-phosphatase [Ruminococcus sp.]